MTSFGANVCQIKSLDFFPIFLTSWRWAMFKTPVSTNMVSNVFMIYHMKGWAQKNIKIQSWCFDHFRTNIYSEVFWVMVICVASAFYSKGCFRDWGTKTSQYSVKPPRRAVGKSENPGDGGRKALVIWLAQSAKIWHTRLQQPCTIWQYGLWSFQMGVTKLERFLPKNQHTQEIIEFWELD